jgi:hypothetical protein
MALALTGLESGISLKSAHSSLDPLTKCDLEIRSRASLSTTRSEGKVVGDGDD